MMMIIMLFVIRYLTAQSAGIVEYTDCISAEDKTLQRCPGYDIKRSDAEALDLGFWGIRSILSLSLLPGPL